MNKSALAAKADGDGEAKLRDLQLTQEAQARYMSFLSHDLRGSLNGLVLMVEVLKREIEGKAASTDEVLADLAMMKRALVDTVATMERHVLADRLRRGVLEIKRQPVKLAEVVELVDNLARHCGQCQAKIAARKFGGAWMIEVADDGPGIPAGRLEQFVDPLKRGELKERGLGLNLVQLVASGLGGRLEARTDDGDGCAFQLWIPIEGGSEAVEKGQPQRVQR